MTLNLSLEKIFHGNAGLATAKTDSMTNTKVSQDGPEITADIDIQSVIVFDNGRSGFLGEHSCMDGTPTLRMNEFVLASIALNKVNLGAARTPDTGKDLPEPAELQFEINGKVQQLVKEAEARFDELVGQHDLHVRRFPAILAFPVLITTI